MTSDRSSARRIGFGRALGLAGLAALVPLLVTGAPSAAAHAVVLAADPPDGARLSTLPAQATLTFSDTIPQAYARAALTVPGHAATEVPVSMSGPVMTVPLRAAGPGCYRVTYRVVSADGHPVSGQVSFSVGAVTSASLCGTGPTGPGGGSSASASAPVRGAILAIVVLALGLGGAAIRRGLTRRG